MKKKIMAIMIITALLLGFLVGFFLRPYKPQALLSASSVYIEQLTGAGFGSDGELKKCYWEVTFTVDVFQSQFFILDKDFTYVGTNNITDVFQGKKVRPQSVINISFIPLEPYIVIKDPDTPADTILIIPEIYNVKPPGPLPREKFDAFIATVYPFIQPYYHEIHTPFKVEVRKNNNLISNKIIDAIGAEKEFFLVGDETKEENARIDVAGKLGSGINTAWGDFVWFGPDKVLRLQTNQGKDVREHLRYKSTTYSYLYYGQPRTVEIPDYQAMSNAGGTFFQYWICGATTNDEDVFYKYHWHDNIFQPGSVNIFDTGNLSAIGKNRPPICIQQLPGGSSFLYVDAYYCDKYPGWTQIDSVDMLITKYYFGAVYNYPSLTEDNPGTNPVGLSVYNWLIQQKGAYMSDLKGPYVTRTELKDDSVYVYYQPGTLGWDIVSLRISTELADTYVYGEYTTNFDITKAYWQRTEADYIELSGGVPEYLVVDVKNTGNVSANAQLKVKAVYPSNFLDIVSMPTNVISNTTIAPGNVYTFKLQAVNRGTPSSFDFKLEISVWCEAYQRDTAYVIGRVLEASCTLRIYTVGDSAKAKIWLNDELIPRNKGTYYEGTLPKGTYTIKFEELEGFNTPYITVDSNFAGYTSVQVTLESGKAKSVTAYYVSSEVKLMAGFISWSDKGIFGWSPAYNPLGTSRPTVPEWHIVRLTINATALGVVEGDLKIIILADVEEAPSYYAEKTYHITLGSGASQMYSIDFMLGGTKGYYYMVQLGDTVIYVDYNADTRPEVFVTPWYVAYGLYIGIGIITIIAIVLVLYYLKWRALRGY
jgi:archaellum component FlaG (FlaF/FlaG flagellin family)